MLQIDASGKAIEIGPDSVEAAGPERLLAREPPRVETSCPKPRPRDIRAAEHRQQPIAQRHQLPQALPRSPLRKAPIRPPALDRPPIYSERQRDDFKGQAQVALELIDQRTTA